jgi:hypothetical protein
MVTAAADGIDLFKIAGRSISGWIPSLKTGITVRQPFCSQLEERLLIWLEYCNVPSKIDSKRREVLFM